MDFSDSPEEAAYRAKVQAWLAANAPKVGFSDTTGMTIPDEIARARAWQTKKAAAGFAQITWSKDWGGPGGTPMQQVIYNQEEAKYDVDSPYFVLALGMCVPTILTVADEATKQRFVGPALRGEEIWCQLFSEPVSGSDAAGARTMAVRTGDEWVVNGQKVWTSGAHLADYGLLLARTDVDVPKHKGMTMYWLDMKSPGVEVRRINQMSGNAGFGFNEVFFTDVKIPDSQRLGAVGEGWKVAIVTLMNERFSIGGGGAGGWSSLMQMARDAGQLGDRALRDKIADWYVQSEGLKHTAMRTITALSRGQTPGPESSIGKIVGANQAQALASEAVDLLDQYGIICDPALAPLEAEFQVGLLRAPGSRLAGGTDEILRNILAERVLGLPGDIRLDKDVAFKDIPSGR